MLESAKMPHKVDLEKFFDNAAFSYQNKEARSERDDVNSQNQTTLFYIFSKKLVDEDDDEEELPNPGKPDEGCDFKCNDGTCQSNDKRCNGIKDCSDGIDETNCGVCTRQEFKCKSTNECLDYSKRCDGQTDCSDGSDENLCQGSYFFVTILPTLVKII